MTIEDAVLKIKERYNYDIELTNIIAKVISGMITYYGEENQEKIFNTFMDTPIAFYETQEDVANFYKSLGIRNVDLMPGIASGGFLEKFQLNDANEVERIPSILIKRPTSMENDVLDAFYETIVHECCHAFMNYGKSHFENGKITTSTGLIKTKITLSKDDDIVEDEFVNVEEGMTDYDAIVISNLVFGRGKGSKIYDANVKYVSTLMNDDQLRKIVNSSRADGDDKWKSILGTELSDRFLNAFENYYSVFFGNNLTPEEKEQMKVIAKQELKQTYNEVLNTISALQQMQEQEISRLM